MGTLSPSWRRTPSGLSPRPRIYADANVPAGIVAHMRQRLHWDVLFVLEEADLRRAPDVKHYQLAQQLRRTLVTLDRDYLDDRRFPPDEGGGVLVIQAPDERQLRCCSIAIDRSLFHPDDVDEPVALPLAGRKLQVNTDWGRRLTPCMIGLELRRSRAPSRSPSTSRATCWRAREADAGGDLGAAAAQALERGRSAAAGGSASAVSPPPIPSRRPIAPVVAQLAQRFGGVVQRQRARCRRARRRPWPKRGSARRAACRTSSSSPSAEHATGGIVRDGARGDRRAAAARASVAWLALNPVEREDYRKIGCLEAEVAAAGIVRRLIWRIKAGDRSRVQDIVERRSVARSPSSTCSTRRATATACRSPSCATRRSTSAWRRRTSSSSPIRRCSCSAASWRRPPICCSSRCAPRSRGGCRSR